MTNKEKKSIIINEILIPSLRILYKEDYTNILWNVSERNICARLAHHMENIMRNCKNKDIFRGYYADVEYNRMGNGKIKCYENTEHLPQPMVSDLLIQSRGLDPNYLAVELKKEKNHEKIKEDKARLMSLVSPKPFNKQAKGVHDTLVGAFITFSSFYVKIEIYTNIDGKGEKVDEINFQCRTDGYRCVSLDRI